MPLEGGRCNYVTPENMLEKNIMFGFEFVDLKVELWGVAAADFDFYGGAILPLGNVGFLDAQLCTVKL